MTSAKKTAKIVGVLFIVATTGSIVSGSIVQSIISSPEDLVNIPANVNKLLIAVIFLLALAVSVVLIPALMFPVLKKEDETIALGYFGLRIIEALTPMVDVLGTLMLISLSRDFVNAGTPNETYFQTIGGLLLAMRDWAFILNPIIFGFGSILLNYSLYNSKIIPRWLSSWGILGALLVTMVGMMGMFGNFIIVLALPIALQEMVFAVWLIVKGFNSQ